MTSQTDICNQALAGVPTRSTIASITENSPEARICAMFYQDTLDAMLRAAHWDFARKTAFLTILKAAYGTPENTSSNTTGQWDPTQPSPPWLYSYAYPSDCVLFRYVVPQFYTSGASAGTTPIFSVPSLGAVPPYVSLSPQKFQKGTDTDANGNQVTCILSNQDQAIGIYTARTPGPDNWDPLFKQAMVAALTVRIALPLKGDKKAKEDARAEALALVQQAQASNGNEGLTNVNKVPDWIRIRGYAGDWGLPGADCTGAWMTPSFLTI